ncbi:MAG TPA: hypothetical protein PLV92_20025, partial [Pirellulaceae bacterium]|nr:hypothetical protein [Pirellulaceae bacterium]
MTQRLYGAASGRGGAWVVGLLALCGFVVATGCGGGSTEPVTARNSAFEAGDGDAAAVAQGPGGAAAREDGASANGAGRGASGGGAAATDSADSSGGATRGG